MRCLYSLTLVEIRDSSYFPDSSFLLLAAHDDTLPFHLLLHLDRQSDAEEEDR